MSTFENIYYNSLIGQRYSKYIYFNMENILLFFEPNRQEITKYLVIYDTRKCRLISYYHKQPICWLWTSITFWFRNPIKRFKTIFSLIFCNCQYIFNLIYTCPNIWNLDAYLFPTRLQKRKISIFNINEMLGLISSCQIPIFL